jgi:hypothetical protein
LDNIPGLIEGDREERFSKVKIFEGYYRNGKFQENLMKWMGGQEYTPFGRGLIGFDGSFGNCRVDGTGMLYNKNGKLALLGKMLQGGNGNRTVVGGESSQSEITIFGRLRGSLLGLENNEPNTINSHKVGEPRSG